LPDNGSTGHSPIADPSKVAFEPIPAIAAALMRRPDRAADHKLASFSGFLLFFGQG